MTQKLTKSNRKLQKVPQLVAKLSCKSCIRRYICLEPCDAARDYASKDYLPQRELPIGTPLYAYGETFLRSEANNRVKFSNRDIIVSILESFGIPRVQIAHNLGLSMVNLRSIVLRIRKKMQRIEQNKPIDVKDNLIDG